jgi:hypothetical protein
MNSLRYSILLGLAILLAVAPPSQGQRPPNDQSSPHIAYIYPAGGQRDTTFQVVVGGKFLDGVSNAYLSGRGIQVTVKTHTRPLSQHEHHDLMNKMKVLEEQRTAAVGSGGRRAQLATTVKTQSHLSGSRLPRHLAPRRSIGRSRGRQFRPCPPRRQEFDRCHPEMRLSSLHPTRHGNGFPVIFSKCLRYLHHSQQLNLFAVQPPRVSGGRQQKE